MRDQRRSIAVRALPRQIDGAGLRELYRELESCINVDRPAVVLDCSKLSKLDKPAIHFLLCCLEEAMKRNGDVRLAALQSEARTAIQSTGLGLLFQTFESVGEALESFRSSQVNAISQRSSSKNDQRTQENAA